MTKDDPINYFDYKKTQIRVILLANYAMLRH